MVNLVAKLYKRKKLQQILISVPAHFSTKNKQISVAKGKQVHVQCNVQGDTPIDIKWKIQNTQQHLDESLDTR